LLVPRLSERAVLPVRGSPLAAGYDIASAEDTVVPARGKALVKTDLSIAVPEGCYGRVGSPSTYFFFFLSSLLAPRSGLAWKKFIDVGAGVIDADYRGPLGVVLFNHGDEDFKGAQFLAFCFEFVVVAHGDRIAQLILERIASCVFVCAFLFKFC
jgi:dUTP pyrophosphatase